MIFKYEETRGKMVRVENGEDNIPTRALDEETAEIIARYYYFYCQKIEEYEEKYVRSTDRDKYEKYFSALEYYNGTKEGISTTLLYMGIWIGRDTEKNVILKQILVA